MTDFKLGQRVAYAEQIQRRHARPGEFNGPHRIWSNEAYPGMGKHPGGEGIIIGKRTLSNGMTEWWEDSGTSYRPTEHFEAYVVAYDLHRKPVYVLPEHLTALEVAA